MEARWARHPTAKTPRTPRYGCERRMDRTNANEVHEAAYGGACGIGNPNVGEIADALLVGRSRARLGAFLVLHLGEGLQDWPKELRIGLLFERGHLAEVLPAQGRHESRKGLWEMEEQRT